MAKTKKVIINDQEVDLFPGTLKVAIEYNISNIKDLTARNNSKTTTIDIPASAANKKLFGFPEDFNAADPIDQTTKPVAKLEVEGTTLISGFAKVEEAITNDRISNYKLRLLGDNGDWRERIKDRKISDLDYSSDNHTLNHNTVVNSWNISASRNYVYDLIDRGFFTGKNSITSLNGTGVNIEDCYPAISFSSILEKIFTAIGYRISSSFTSSLPFTKSYFPFINAVFKHEDTWGDDKKFKAVQTKANSGSPNPIIYFKTSNLSSQTMPFYYINDATNDGFDTGGLYHFWDTPQFIKSFKAPTTCEYKFHYKFPYYVAGQITTLSIFFQLMRKDVNGNIKIVNGSQYIGATAHGSFNVDFTTPYVNLEAGDLVWLTIDMNSAIGTSFNVSVPNHISGNPYTENYLELVDMRGPFPIATGQPVNMNSNLPDIGQLDFIQALKDEWNLYFLPDVEARIIYIEPRDDFYSGTAIDWSAKVDRNKPIIIESLGDNYTKRLRYKFKEDSNDKFISEWNKKNDDSFGSYEVALENEFANDERTDIENKLFAATWMDIAPYPLVGLKTVKIPRMWTDVMQPQKSTGFAPRILYYAGVTALTATDAWALSNLDRAPLYPKQVINQQYVFPRFYFYGEAAGEYNLRYDNTDTAHGCFDNNYKNTHKIIDYGRLVTMNVYLKDIDVSNFDFRVPVYIELEGNGSTFEVQSIDAYDPDINKSTTVKLLKQVGQTALASVSPSKKKNGPKIVTPIDIKTEKTTGGDVITYITINNQTIITINNGVVNLQGREIYAEINGIMVPVLYTDASNNLSKVILE